MWRRGSRSRFEVRWVPKRSVAASLAALLGAFFAAPAIGLALAMTVAPESRAAEIASFLAFPAALFLGLVAWLGVGVASVVLAAVGALLRGRLPAAPAEGADRVAVPPGHAAFVVCSVALAVFAGIVAGLTSTASFAAATAVYGGAGLGYGWSLRALARHGYLPFPEPE
jgi:hypothetical protein